MVKAPEARAGGLLEGYGQRRKIHFSETESVPLLNLGRVEMVEKLSKEMLVTFSVHFRELPVF